MQKIILASSSFYKKNLMARLGIDFEAVSPQFDEDTAKISNQNLTPHILCQQLAIEKARSLAVPNSLIIGADQMVTFESQILGKPLSAEKAKSQLQLLQGRTHNLLTAVSVRLGSTMKNHLQINELKMHALTQAQITAYVDLDKPLDCAGSYKIEEHGISLFEAIKSDDFTGIEGLPLIHLTRILKEFGIIIPKVPRSVL